MRKPVIIDVLDDFKMQMDRRRRSAKHVRDVSELLAACHPLPLSDLQRTHMEIMELRAT